MQAFHLGLLDHDFGRRGLGLKLLLFEAGLMLSVAVISDVDLHVVDVLIWVLDHLDFDLVDVMSDARLLTQLDFIAHHRLHLQFVLQLLQLTIFDITEILLLLALAQVQLETWDDVLL